MSAPRKYGPWVIVPLMLAIFLGAFVALTAVISLSLSAVWPGDHLVLAVTLAFALDVFIYVATIGGAERDERERAQAGEREGERK